MTVRVTCLVPNLVMLPRIMNSLHLKTLGLSFRLSLMTDRPEKERRTLIKVNSISHMLMHQKGGMLFMPLPSEFIAKSKKVYRYGSTVYGLL